MSTKHSQCQHITPPQHSGWIIGSHEWTHFYHLPPQGGPLHFYVCDPNCAVSSRMDRDDSPERPFFSRNILRRGDHDISNLEICFISEPFLPGRQTWQPFFHPSLPYMLHKLLNSAPSFLRIEGHLVYDLRCKLATNLTMQEMIRSQWSYVLCTGRLVS